MIVPLRLALIGTGRAARARLRDLAATPEAQFVVVASHDPARAAELARPLGVSAVGDPLAAISQANVDAVIISTRNEWHAALCAAALRAGKHVCVEYPLALSLREGDALLREAAERGLVLHVEHIDLLSPWFQTVCHHLHRIGDLMAMNWTDISARQPKPGDWTFARASGFSLFAGASVLSRMVRIGGFGRAARAVERLDGLTPEGYFTRRLTSAFLEFASGATGTICDGTGFAAAGPESELRVIGTEGTLTGVGRQHVTLAHSGEVEELPTLRGESLFAQDTASFCRQVLRGEPSYLPPGHVKAVLELAQMAEDSLPQF